MALTISIVKETKNSILFNVFDRDLKSRKSELLTYIKETTNVFDSEDRWIKDDFILRHCIKSFLELEDKNERPIKLITSMQIYNDMVIGHIKNTLDDVPLYNGSNEPVFIKYDNNKFYMSINNGLFGLKTWGLHEIAEEVISILIAQGYRHIEEV